MFEKIKNSVIKNGRRNKYLLPFAVAILFTFHVGQRVVRTCTNLSEETLIALWRGKLRRGMALALCFCMIVTMVPPSALAKEKEAENGETVISGFAALPDDVREQTVPIGTSLEELNLPETMEAVYFVPEESTKPLEETSESMDETTDSTEETIPEGTTDSTEETIPEGTTDPTKQPDSEESKVPETETESEEGSTSEIETEAETGESSAPAEENNQEESAAPAKEDEQEETNLSAKLEVFSTTVKSPQYLAMPNDIPAGEIMILSEQEVLSKTSSSDEISSSEVTVTGVIWVSDPAYDGETEGEYIFTPVLPDGYVVEKGVILPEIIVTVSESLPDEMTEMVAKLLALIDALPAPADAFEQSDKPWRADVEAAEAARAALTDEQRAALPEEAVQKLDDLLHFLEVEGDCVDFGCPWHYPPELLKLMNKNEMPAPLTMDNLIEDYGVAQPRLLFAARTATYPQTLIVTSDNENNAHRGIADGDLDRMFNCWDNSHPIEVRFELDQVPSQSAYLAIRAFDIDSGEDNKVYVNGTKVGQLSGMSDTWNITVLEIPTRLLKTGKNYVEIKLDQTLYMNVMLQKVPVYSARVDWMQLVLDGGTADSGITGFEIKLDEPFNSGKYAQIPVTATITQSGTTQYNTEYTLKKGSSTLDIVFSNTSGKENVTLRLPKDCASGLYEIVALVKDPVTGEVKARERVNFYHVKNVGAELSPKITHTLTPNGPTNRNVEINITVEDNMGYTDVSIEAGNHHTVDANKDYMYWVSYTVGNSRRRFEYTVPVNNIDKTPPVITYTPFSVEEGIVDAEISRLFEKALCVTEDGQLAGEPSYTLPENFAATMGEKTVTVTATDAAGNTATKDCVITVLPLSVRLTQQTPVRVDATDRFTLSATLEDTGGLSFTETGFVWGVMQNPTIRICNGRLATDSPVTTRGGSITVTAPDIVDGVDYYARAYTLAGGRVYYSDQMRFSIGEKKYGVFRVQNQGGGTFTITRSDGSAEEQTVYYRTVNGSAVGGTHFTHRSGSIVFAQGETSKTVTVEEAKVDAVYGGNSATGYSNADRTYQLEIYRVQGGGTIAAGGARATRTMPKNADKTIDRSIYEYRQAKEVSNLNKSIWEDQEDNYKGTVPIDGLTCAALNGSVYPGGQVTYLSNTASAMRFQLKDFNAWDNWTMQRYILFSNMRNVKFARDKGGKLPELSAKGTKCALIYSRQGDTNSKEQTTFDFPRSNGTVLGTGSSSGVNYVIQDAKWEDGQDPSGDYVLFNLNETCYIALGSYNHAARISAFTFNSAKLFCAPHDTREPQVMGIAPMAGGLYKPGDSVTVSLVFDEIVDGTNSSLSGTTIDTNYGTMTYAGGADTNVLYYTGTVPVGASGAVTLNSFSNPGSIRDMCKDDGTVSDCSGSKTTIEVDGIQPTVNIKAGGIKDGTATGTITATNSDLLQYTWTQSAAMPVAGWLTCANGDNVQTRQLSGEWYLHTLATRSTNGATAYARQSFNFGTLENPVSPLPTLTLSADNTNWAHSRNITVTRTPADAGVAYAGPESGIAGGTVNVTRNGLYTFTLTSGDETITEQVLVSRLDDVAPTLTIQESGNTDAIYNELNFCASASDSLSGIAKVEYSWSDTTTSGGWTAAGGTGGSYTIPTYTATETTQSIKYLHVRATDNAGNVTTQVSQGYTVVKAPLPANLPAITLTGSPSAWTKGPVNLSWKVTGLGAGGIWVNVGESTSTQESGTLSADKNGLYSVMVTDKNRRSASAMCLVNKIDAEAPVLGAVSCAPTGWAPKKTVTLSDVSDNRTPVFDADGNVTGYTGSGLKKQEWKQSGGEYMTFTGSSIDATANGIYTVRLTDQVGNQSEYAVAVSGIDSVAPTVSVGIPATDWTSAAQNIKITYTDQTDGSGIATAQYAITTTASGAKPTTLSNLPTSGQSISVSANGTSYIYYKVTDNAGNVTEGYSNPIKVDTQTPTLTVTGGTSGAKNQTLTVISAFGTSNGKVAVSKDGGTAADVTGNSYLVTAKGAYTFTATSGAGKTATVIIHAYGITFDSKGGSLEPAQIVVKGGKATQPANPTKTGYTFTKWQKVGADYDFNTEINADITLAAAWTLDAPAVKLAVDHAETTYNGGSTVATLTATPEHTAAGVTYTYEWYRGSTKLNGTGSTMPLTDAVHSGSYTVKVTADDGTLNSTQVTSNTVTVTINKADTEITTAPTASGITYGQALSGSTLNGGVATAAATSFLGRLTHVFKSGASVPGTFSWTTGTINPAVSDSDSTDYSVTFTPTDTANYNSSTSTITLKVDKATLTPSVNTVSSKTYDGNAAASGTIVLAGAVLGESPAASGTFAFTDSNAGENKRVNVTGIALTGSWGGNYTLDKTELPNAATTAAIKPKTVGLNWHGYTGLVYDTNAVHVTATATELIGADVCTVTVTGGTETNAGSYTATATAVNNSNYKLPTTGLTQGYTIAKAPVSFVVSDNVYDYDVSAKSATVVQTAGETPDVSGKFTVSYKKDGAVAAAPTAKGIYDVMVTLNDPNFKHETSNDVEIQVGNLTINGVPYPNEITWPTAAAITYGQTLDDSALTGGVGVGTFSWEVSDTVPTVQNSGYTVIFTPTDTSYTPEGETVSITVSKATPTLTLPAAGDITYGETLADSGLAGGSASATVGGMPADVPGSYRWTAPETMPKFADSNNTEYALTFTPTDTANYNVVRSGKVKLAVAQKPVSLTWAGHTELIYNGAPVSVTATATGLVGNDICTVTVTDGAKTDAGNYTATATGLSNDNYTLPDVTTQSYTIAQKPVKVLWSDMFPTYDGAAKFPTVALEGVLNDEDCTVSSTGSTATGDAGRPQRQLHYDKSQ